MAYCEKHNIPVDFNKKEKSPTPWTPTCYTFPTKAANWKILDRGRRRHGRWSVAPEAAPDKAEYLEISFQNGDPVAPNGVAMSPASLWKPSIKLVAPTALAAWI